MATKGGAEGVVRYAGELPGMLREGALLVHGLMKGEHLAELASRLVVQRRPGYVGVDAFLYLVYFHAAGGHLGGLRGFYEDVREWRAVLGAVGGRVSLMSCSALSRLLAALEADAVAAVVPWLVLHVSGALEVLRTRAVMTGDALGDLWHLFDFDPSRNAYRQRALYEGADAPAPVRRVRKLAARGHAGRKRGEVVSTDGLLQHAGSGLWLNMDVQPGNGGARVLFASAVAAMVNACDALGHRRDRALLRADGEFGGVPYLTIARDAGIAFLSRMSRYELLDCPEVRARLANARWERVPDSGSGPRRYAADLGEFLITPGATTRWADGTPFDPIMARVTVTRCVRATSGSGTKIGDEIIEMFVSVGMSVEAWSAASLVEAYYGRIGQENRFAQFDRAFEADTTWSTTPAGQCFALACAQFVWNARIVAGVRAHGPLPEPPPQQKREPEVVALPPIWPEEPASPTGAPSVTPDEEQGRDRDEATLAHRDTGPAVDPAVAEALSHAQIDKRIAKRPGWRWEAQSAVVVTPEGDRLPLAEVEGRKLRFWQNKAKRQATVTVPQEVAERIRATLRPERSPGREQVRPRPLVARTPVELIRTTSQVEPGGYATRWPTFLPAAARRRAADSVNATSIRVELTIAARPKPPPDALTSDVPRLERSRRLTHHQRLARYGLGAGDTLTLEVKPRRSGPTVTYPDPKNMRSTT